MLAAALVGFGPAAQPAAACSCAPPPQDLVVERSGLAFIGTLVDRRPTPPNLATPTPEPGVPAPPTPYGLTLEFEVDIALKGDLGDRQIIRTAAYGASCGLELSGPGPHLVVAEPGSTPSSARAHLCGGSRTLEEGEVIPTIDRSLGEGTSVAYGFDDTDRRSRGPVILVSIVAIFAILGLGGSSLRRR